MKIGDLATNPTLQQLYNAQKARVYEFILAVCSNQKNGGIEYITSGYGKDWYDQPSARWGVNNISTDEKLNIKYKRVHPAKLKYEKAGGKYPFEFHDIGPRGGK